MYAAVCPTLTVPFCIGRQPPSAVDSSWHARTAKCRACPRWKPRKCATSFALCAAGCYHSAPVRLAPRWRWRSYRVPGEQFGAWAYVMSISECAGGRAIGDALGPHEWQILRGKPAQVKHQLPMGRPDARALLLEVLDRPKSCLESRQNCMSDASKPRRGSVRGGAASARTGASRRGTEQARGSRPNT